MNIITQIKSTKAFIFAKKIYSEAIRLNIASFAASTSFFLFLSLFPMIILLCSIIPFTPLNSHYILTVAGKLLPDSMLPLLSSIVAQGMRTTAGTFTFTIIIAIWSAGTGTSELVKAITTINESQNQIKFLRHRLFSSLYTIIMIFVLIASLLLLVFGRRILIYLLAIIDSAEMYGKIERILHVQYIFAFGVLLLLFLLLYAKSTVNKSSFRKCIPGAFVCALAWSLFTYIFALFLHIYNPFTTYGSLATTIITMLWMYICMYFVMIGAIINKQAQKKPEALNDKELQA